MLIVQKYGGTSVGTPDRIRAVAQRCVETQRAGHSVVVVVSAMAGETNRLLGLARSVASLTDLTHDSALRESDVVLAAGEQVSTGLLALAITALGVEGVSMLGHQVKVLSDSSFSRARILNVEVDRIQQALAQGKLVVLAGFQGSDLAGNITTLGRGGSDTSAVAVAAALRADVCEIYTDVNGVYSADPNAVVDARLLPRISYDEMLELAALGAKVLQSRSVELGKKYSIPIHVRSSFNHLPGTWVVDEELTMESVLVSAVTSIADEAKITLVGVRDEIGMQAAIFRPIAEAGICVDIIVQAQGENGRTNLAFSLPRTDAKRACQVLTEKCPQLCNASNIRLETGLAKVSIIGAGMRSHTGVAHKMFELMAHERIKIHLISTSEIKISCVVDEDCRERAVRVLHQGFQLQLGSVSAPGAISAIDKGHDFAVRPADGEA